MDSPLEVHQISSAGSIPISRRVSATVVGFGDTFDVAVSSTTALLAELDMQAVNVTTIRSEIMVCACGDLFLNKR